MKRLKAARAELKLTEEFEGVTAVFREGSWFVKDDPDFTEYLNIVYAPLKFGNQSSPSRIRFACEAALEEDPRVEKILAVPSSAWLQRTRNTLSIL